MSNQHGQTPEDVFGRRVRAERIARGWSQADLSARIADATGEAPYITLVAKIEARDAATPRVIRLDEAAAIARAFGVSLADLLSEAPSPAVALHRSVRDLGEVTAKVSSAADEVRQEATAYLSTPLPANAMAGLITVGTVESGLHRITRDLRAVTATINEVNRALGVRHEAVDKQRIADADGN